MSPTSKREHIHAVRQRYAHASKQAKGRILDELCATLGYHREAAIRVLAGPAPRSRSRRRSSRTYGDQALGVQDHLGTSRGAMTLLSHLSMA
jgi:hypothetical protein